MNIKRNSENALSADKLLSNIRSKKYKYILNCNLFINHTIKIHINAIKYKLLFMDRNYLPETANL